MGFSGVTLGARFPRNESSARVAVTVAGTVGGCRGMLWA